MTQKTKRVRSKNLNDDNIENIVGIIDGWSEKLTWDNLIDEIEVRSKNRYTRQTLANYTRIKSAFVGAKQRILNSTNNKNTSPFEREVLEQRLERLEAENTRLASENHDLLTQFARWAYNAHAKGISKKELDKPLPTIDRR